jgi:hypothetical protein
MSEEEQNMISSNDYIIYPLVVINDRYNGVYSGAEWTAWEDYPDAIPDDIFGDDDSCCEFWLKANKNNIGFGNTPDEAIADLRQKLTNKDKYSKY